MHAHFGSALPIARWLIPSTFEDTWDNSEQTFVVREWEMIANHTHAL